jgi:DNA-binding XRE family transcriptional regulator
MAGDDKAAAGLEEMWRALGRQLRALRREAGLSQQELAAQANFARPTVSVAEIGRAIQQPDFWIACDRALGTGGVLAAGARQIVAARRAGQRAAACAAQEARETRALAAFTAARDQRGVTAGVSAVQDCPSCGSQITVLTTLIPGTAADARSPARNPAAVG